MLSIYFDKTTARLFVFINKYISTERKKEKDRMKFICICWRDLIEKHAWAWDSLGLREWKMVLFSTGSWWDLCVCVIMICFYDFHLFRRNVRWMKNTFLINLVLSQRHQTIFLFLFTLYFWFSLLTKISMNIFAFVLQVLACSSTT